MAQPAGAGFGVRTAWEASLRPEAALSSCGRGLAGAGWGCARQSHPASSIQKFGLANNNGLINSRTVLDIKYTVSPSLLLITVSVLFSWTSETI